MTQERPKVAKPTKLRLIERLYLIEDSGPDVMFAKCEDGTGWVFSVGDDRKPGPQPTGWQQVRRKGSEE
jgi:hypothetical protein